MKLKRDSGLSNLPLWIYFQLRSFVGGTTRQGNFSRQMTDLEKVCAERAQVQKVTLVTYTWLQYANLNTEDRFRKHWSTALKMTITDNQWKKACILADKCSISTKTQKMSYKLLTDWYDMPAKFLVCSDLKHMLEMWGGYKYTCTHLVALPSPGPFGARSGT